MAAKKRGAVRARRLCRHFEDTNLSACARAGLEALEADHKATILGGAAIGCGVALDRCRQEQEPDVRRWDYVFTAREGNDGVAIEVHHAAADEVPVMIGKKDWAMALLARECPNLQVQAWVWVASPPTGDILFGRQHPNARMLADAGIHFPVPRLHLP